MKLSIIIPVYNTERYLKDCLDSIFNEIGDSNQVEVILVDDGSTDKSSEIYNSYLNYNLKVFKNKNFGVSYSRNFALSKACGKWIMFLDSDDLLLKNWYSQVSKYFNSKADIVYFFQNSYEDISKEYFIDNIVGILHDFKYASFPGARIFKRSLIEDNNIKFNEKIINGEDLLFNLLALLCTKKIEFNSSSIYKYRYNIFSSTKTFNEKIFLSDKLFHEELANICEKYKLQKKEIYCQFSIKNAIYLLAHRMSLVDKKNNLDKYFTIFLDDPYNNFLNNYSLSDVHSFNDLIVYFISKHKYSFAIKLLRFKKFIKHKIKLRNKNSFFESV